MKSEKKPLLSLYKYTKLNFLEVENMCDDQVLLNYNETLENGNKEILTPNVGHSDASCKSFTVGKMRLIGNNLLADGDLLKSMSKLNEIIESQVSPTNLAPDSGEEEIENLTGIVRTKIMKEMKEHGEYSFVSEVRVEQIMYDFLAFNIKRSAQGKV